MKTRFLLFSGNFDIESFLDWVYEVEKFFDIAYVSKEKQVKFMAYKPKEERPHGGTSRKSQGDAKANTYHDMAALETTSSE